MNGVNENGRLIFRKISCALPLYAAPKEITQILYATIGTIRTEPIRIFLVMLVLWENIK